MSRLQPHLTIAEGDVVLIRARVRSVYADSVTVRVLNAQGAGFAQLGVAPACVEGLAVGDLDAPAITWR